MEINAYCLMRIQFNYIGNEQHNEKICGKYLLNEMRSTTMCGVDISRRIEMISLSFGFIEWVQACCDPHIKQSSLSD